MNESQISNETVNHRITSSNIIIDIHTPTSMIDLIIITYILIDISILF